VRIVGYGGPRDAVSVLIEGLARLEYVDTTPPGVAVLNAVCVETRKLAGRIAGLRELLARTPVHGRCGIDIRAGHHGAPTGANAHPHTDCTGDARRSLHNGHHRERRRASASDWSRTAIAS